MSECLTAVSSWLVPTGLGDDIHFNQILIDLRRHEDWIEVAHSPQLIEEGGVSALETNEVRIHFWTEVALFQLGIAIDTLAEKRGPNYKWCDPDDSDYSGPSTVRHLDPFPAKHEHFLEMIADMQEVLENLLCRCTVIPPTTTVCASGTAVSLFDYITGPFKYRIRGDSPSAASALSTMKADTPIDVLEYSGQTFAARFTAKYNVVNHASSLPTDPGWPSYVLGDYTYWGNTPDPGPPASDGDHYSFRVTVGDDAQVVNSVTYFWILVRANIRPSILANFDSLRLPLNVYVNDVLADTLSIKWSDLLDSDGVPLSPPTESTGAPLAWLSTTFPLLPDLGTDILMDNPSNPGRRNDVRLELDVANTVGVTLDLTTPTSPASAGQTHRQVFIEAGLTPSTGPLISQFPTGNDQSCFEVTLP